MATEHSPVCDLPYILPSQAQKHVTHNAAIRRLDALVQMRVIASGRADTPSNPDEGAAYIVASGATGTFEGHDNAVAVFQDGAWTFVPPRPGLLAYVESDQAFVFCNGTAWETLLSGSFPTLGVNATADTTNRLAVSADAALFSHAGTDHRVVVNKALASDTASVLFQTNYSGRAEFGTVGSDDFALKVSADGTTFREAMRFDVATGTVNFPAGIAGARERLSADRTYYLDPTGSDGNDGLAASTPFASVQHAIDIATGLDCAGFSVTLQLAAGTYDGSVRLDRPLMDCDTFTLSGDINAPGTVVLRNSSHLVSVDRGAVITVQGVALETYSLGDTIFVTGGGYVSVGNVEFGTAARDHMEIDGLGTIMLTADYTITGGAACHYFAKGSGANIESTNITTTVTGTPDFSNAFALARNNAIIDLWSAVFSGAATGKRYKVIVNASINNAGPGHTDLPGDTDGIALTGGQYPTV